jgi:hypothetical protein
MTLTTEDSVIEVVPVSVLLDVEAITLLSVTDRVPPLEAVTALLTIRLDTSVTEVVPVSDAVLGTRDVPTDVASVMDDVPVSEDDNVTRRDVVSVIDPVPASVTEDVELSTLDSVTEDVPVSVLELLLASTLDSVIDRVPVSVLVDVDASTLDSVIEVVPVSALEAARRLF